MGLNTQIIPNRALTATDPQINDVSCSMILQITCAVCNYLNHLQDSCEKYDVSEMILCDGKCEIGVRKIVIWGARSNDLCVVAISPYFMNLKPLWDSGSIGGSYNTSTSADGSFNFRAISARS